MGWFILAAYPIATVVTTRIALSCLTYDSSVIESDNWMLAWLLGLLWPLTLICTLFYLLGLALRPLVIPASVRRAKRARKLSDRREAEMRAECEAKAKAREHQLPWPDGDRDG